MLLTGSINLTDIPKECIKQIQCKDGKTRAFLNIAVLDRKEPVVFGERRYTHFISCAPRKEERKEGVNYYIADLEERTPQPMQPTSQQVEKAPMAAQSVIDELPF